MLCMPAVKHSVMLAVSREATVSLAWVCPPAAPPRVRRSRCGFCGQQGCCVCGRAGVEGTLDNFSSSIK
jgi:hypothetical protein